MKQTMRPITRRSARPLRDWPAEATRSEGQWSRRPVCPLLPREVATAGFLRDRLHVVTGAPPLPGRLSDESVDATLSLMLRRGTL
ncbi:hypothetical protein [Azospirillum sp. ST 5-10]|uniref:hypothetical protein n=1 Tax=unclassified Azospirillum TaxID=2630922 RepID=UPI003F49C45A